MSMTDNLPSVEEVLAQGISTGSRRARFPVKTSSTESFQKILEAAGGVQSSRVLADILGKDLKPRTTRGLMQYLFDQEQGVLLAPMRAGSALVLDALGQENRFEELQGRNPIQSAIDAFQGEFAITGGDVFKTDENDSVPQRLLKWGAALTYDIVTDPTSWVGGAGTIARKTAGEIAINQRRRIFAAATKLAADPVKLVDDLFAKSKNLRLANEQRLAGQAVTPNSAMDILKMAPDGTVTREAMQQEAEREFATEIADSLYREGRAGIRAVAVKRLGSEEAADAFMRSLPDEIAGGLFLKNPITGRPYRRITGGLGQTNDLYRIANQARFYLATSPPSRLVGQYFSGRFGKTFNAVRQNLWDTRTLDKMDEAQYGMRFLDFVSFKNGVRSKEEIGRFLGSRSASWLHAPTAVRASIAEPYRAEFDRWFSLGFHNPELPAPADLGEAAKAGWSTAMRLRSAIQVLHGELREAGIEIGDMGDNWVMLKLSDDAVARRRAEGVITREYNPSMSRKTEIFLSNDPEDLAGLGYPVPGTDNAVFASGLKANEQLKAKGLLPEWEEDPLKIATAYIEWGNAALANRRLVDYLASTGTIVSLPRQTRVLVDTLKTQALSDLILKARPGVQSRLQSSITALRTALRDLLGETSQAAVIAETQAALRRADAEYLQAQRVETLARSRLRNAEQAVAAATPTVAGLAEEFMQYGGLNAEARVAAAQAAQAEAARLERNAAARLARANTRVDDAVNMAALADEAGLDQDVVEAAAAREVAEDKAQREAAAYEQATISAQEARDELEAALLFQQANAQMMGSQRMSQYRAYTQALQDQAASAEALEMARNARIAARKARNAAKADTTLNRIVAIDTVVDAYITTSKDYLSAKARYRDFRRSLQGRKDLTAAEAADLQDLRLRSEAAKAARDAVHKEMRDLLGRAARGPQGPAGAAYAAQVMELAEKLSAEEFTMARFMSDLEAFDNLFQGEIFALNRHTALNVVGDMFAAFEAVRNQMTPEELVKLGRARRSVATARKSEKFLREESYAGRVGMKAREMNLESLAETKAQVYIPRSMKDIYAQRSVIEAFEVMYRIRQDPKDFEQFLNRVMDPLLLLWKTAVTVGRGPAYSATNLAGGLQNNFAGGVGAKEHGMAAKVILSVKKNMRRIEKEFGETISYPEKVDRMVQALAREFKDVTMPGIDGPVNVAEAFVESISRGMAFSTSMVFDLQELQRLGVSTIAPFMNPQQVTTQFMGPPANRSEATWRRVINYLMSNKYQSAMNDLAQMSELYVRFAAVLSGLRRFGDMDSAMSLMYMLHFDYQDLSDAEIWLKRFVPFYTWARNNVPLQLRFMFVTHDKMAKLVNANEEMKNAFGVDGENAWVNAVLPEYMDVTGGFASIFKFGGNHIGLFPKLPFKDVDNWLQVTYLGDVPVILPRVGAVAQAVGPIVSPLEFIAQYSFREGRPYTDRSEALVETAQKLVPYGGLISRALGAASIAVPGLERIDELPGAGLLGLDVRREKGVTDLLQLLVGAPYGTTTLTERTLTSGAIQTSKAYNAQVRKMAAEAGVDLEWLRKQIKDGVPVDQIRVKIAMGQGSPAAVALRKKLQGRPTVRSNRDYREVLQGLGSGGLQTGY